MMKIYVINLVVNTKNTDIYDKVALNKFPIIIKCKTESELKDILTQEQTNKFVRNNIKSLKIFNNAEWYIRHICENDVKEIVWKVSELNTYS